MALPESDIDKLETLLKLMFERRISEESEEKLKLTYEVKGNKITIIESRPFFIDPDSWNSVKVAQFEYNSDIGNWALYWYSTKNRRQAYPTGRNKDSIEKLVDEVDSDPTGIFWG